MDKGILVYIGVLGSEGMLGKAVVEACQEQGVGCLMYPHSRYDIADIDSARRMTQPDAVINCAGIVAKDADHIDMVRTNACGPHILAEYFRKPIVHVSTDCVFSGVYDVPYHVGFPPDPIDLYGRTKLVGEVKADHVLNVRTSFIGFDHGLLAWLCSWEQAYHLEGYQNAIWSGSTVWAVATELVKLATNFNGGGIVHLATAEPIDKYNLLLQLKMVLGLNVAIRPVILPMLDRSLEPTVVLPTLIESYDGLVKHYHEWRRKTAMLNI